MTWPLNAHEVISASKGLLNKTKHKGTQCWIMPPHRKSVWRDRNDHKRGNDLKSLSLSLVCRVPSSLFDSPPEVTATPEQLKNPSFQKHVLY